jgi:hypothetical protein
MKMDLPYVHQFVDRHGKPRYYFRFKSERHRLSAPSDPTFVERYKEYGAQVVDQPSKSNVVFIKGSLGRASLTS